MSETFDTLAAARQLQAAGMERPHAEAVADVVRAGLSGLATEDGMDALRRETRTGMGTSMASMDALLRELIIHRWVLILILAMNMTTLALMLTNAPQP